MEQFISQFHFLRPEWFWGLLPVAIVAVFLFLNTRKKENWRNAISKELLPYLIIRGDSVSRLPKFILLFVLLLMVFSMAGPTWEKIEKPGGRIEAAMVIIVDASKSMLAEDVQPNRLERAKLKIVDMLEASPGAHVAVIAYAGTAHTVIPFTADYKTVNYQIESLSPDVMPVRGSNLAAALSLADSLVEPIDAPNTIVIFTDDASPDDARALERFTNSGNRFEYVVLATPSGAPIPLGGGKFLKDENGNTVVPKLNIDRFKTLGKQENVNVSAVTLDDSDVKYLAANIRQNLIFDKAPEDDDEDWQDAGYWLVIPLALLTLFWFRRGWLVQWSWLLLITIQFSACSPKGSEKNLQIEPLPDNWTFTDLWFTRDQQGQRILDAGNPEEAFDRFEDPRQKAMILYQLDSLEASVAIWATIPTAESYFNQGVIQAELKNWSSAKKAFEKALEINPDFSDASENLNLILKIIEERKSRFSADLTYQDDRLSGNSEENKELEDLEAEPEETDGGKKEEGEPGDSPSGAAQQDDSVLSGELNPQDNNDSKDMVLRQLSDDPAVFLKRKFQHQILTGKVKSEEQKDKW